MKEITPWIKWKNYSIWKKIAIITLPLFGFCIGFVIGYIKGSADLANLVISLANRAIDSANISINLSDIAKGYLLKGLH